MVGLLMDFGVDHIDQKFIDLSLTRIDPFLSVLRKVFNFLFKKKRC